MDWSKYYRDAFDDIRDACGFLAGDGATDYSLRHIFIDEFKKHSIEEYILSLIVGQKHEKSDIWSLWEVAFARRACSCYFNKCV